MSTTQANNKTCAFWVEDRLKLISKLEKDSKNVTIATVLKVFTALKAEVKFRVELVDAAVMP